MNYRTFGKLDWKPSALGFGTMRLPIIGEDPSAIDEQQAITMLRAGIDGGINYVDTAYPYHGGKSETLVGKALQEGYRGKVHLATKMPSWLIGSQADMTHRFEEQLQRMQTDHVEFYLLHALDAERWHKLRDAGVLEWAHERIREGRIGYLGFSFHDTNTVFREIVDAYQEWTFCQIQYNFLDEETQAGTDGLHYAASEDWGSSSWSLCAVENWQCQTQRSQQCGAQPPQNGRRPSGPWTGCGTTPRCRCCSVA